MKQLFRTTLFALDAVLRLLDTFQQQKPLQKAYIGNLKYVPYYSLTLISNYCHTMNDRQPLNRLF